MSNPQQPIVLHTEDVSSTSFKIEGGPTSHPHPHVQASALPALTPENLKQSANMAYATNNNNNNKAATASFSLFGPSGNDGDVVERYVLSEMGAVSELDDALDKAKKTPEQTKNRGKKSLPKALNRGLEQALGTIHRSCG